MISGAIVVKNQVSSGIICDGLLNGNNAASVWKNDINSQLYYRNNGPLMGTGSLQATASPNTVYYDRAGDQIIKNTGYDNLVLMSSGTKTLTSTAVVNDDFIINSGVSFNPAGNNFTVNDTTLIFGTFADGTAAGTTNLQYVELNGGTINGGQTGVINILGDLNIINGDGTIGRVTMTVSGTTTIGTGCTLMLNSNTGIKTFTDEVINNGTWVSTTVGTSLYLVFQNGISNNGASFTAGGCTFNANNQDISGNTALSFASGVTIDGAVTVTNKIADGITITGILNGNNAASIWENDIDAVLYYGNSVMPMATGSFSVDAIPNTVYYNRFGDQSIKGAVYDNLILSSSGVKTTGNDATVNNDFIINAGVSFNPDQYNFSVSDTTLIYGFFADGDAIGTTNLQYTEIIDGTISGNRTGVVNILGDLNITSGDGIIGQVELTVLGMTTIGTGRKVTINNDTGRKKFNGLVVNDGIWASTSVSTADNLIFNGGIENNGASFTAGACTFSANDQSIFGSTSLSLSSDVLIAGAVTVTNSIADGIIIYGVLNGNEMASTWKNDANSVLHYRNTNAPMVTGVFYVDASPNTVYYDLNNDQIIRGTTYDNLILSAGFDKTLNGNTIVNDDFTILPATFNPATYNFAVIDTTKIYGNFADGAVSGVSQLHYTELIDGIIDGGQPGVVYILDNLDITKGNGTIGEVELNVLGNTIVGTGRTILLNDNSGVKSFKGKVINDGTWTSFIVSSANSLVFTNGIENNGISFMAGAATFKTNNQELSGTTEFIFAHPVVINSIDLTNNSIVTMSNTIEGTLSGNGKWIQAENSTLNYAGNTMMINILDASATGNTISYNRSGNQYITLASTNKYYNIEIVTSGTKYLSGNIDVLGDIELSGSAILDVNTHNISLSGNWNNSSSAADPFDEETATVTFNGTEAQEINNTGDPQGTEFYNLVIDNSFPDAAISLNAEVIVDGNLNMNLGHILTDASNILVLGTSASVTLGSSPDDSFVKGPMIHTYDVSGSEVTKVFPIGKGNKMHRADLTINQTNHVATEYTAEFLYSGADGLGYNLPGTLDKVSEADQWIISNGGASNVNTASVTLYYNEEDVVDDPSYLRIAKDDGGGNWIDIGGSGSSSPVGSITSSLNFTSFSTFTLANAKDGKNPLPVELLSFDAHVINDNVFIEWNTVSEINNDYFTVERSTNAQDFEIVEVISGAGNSNELISYSLTDFNPYSGISYYRLKQTDFDGGYSYSNIVAVEIISNNELTLTAWQNGSNLFLSLISDIQGQSNTEIFDCSGKLLLNKSEFIENNETIIDIDISGFMPGMYIIRLTLGTSQKSAKVLINQ